MRILSLGFPLPGPAIDNYSFFSAPSFFDYDALVVDPRAVSQLVDDVVTGGIEHTTYSGEHVVNKADGPNCVSLGEVLHNRADEAARLLVRGGLILCLAVPNAAHEGVKGFTAFSRYAWLPTTANLTLDPPFATRGGGTEFATPDLDHPFGSFVEQMRSKLAYQVHFDESALNSSDHVIVRSNGGAAVGIAVSIAGGRIIFLPPPARSLDSRGRYQASEALQQAVRQELRLSVASAPPRWVAGYDVPGLAALTKEQVALGERLRHVQDATEANNAEMEKLQQYQRLLWDEGRPGLEAVARASLALLGFNVTPDNLESPAKIELAVPTGARREALLEVDGSEGAVGLDVHYRLRRRLEDALVRGHQQRGVVVVNGYRRTPPEERPQQYTPELRLAAEQLQYCLTTGEQLFRIVQASLNGDEPTVERFREQLLTAGGVLAGD